MRAAVPIVLLLSACAAEPAPAPLPERDPASEQALNDQIMIDPDLANQNEGNAALSVPSDHSLPLPVATEESIAAARAEAAVLAGGSDEFVASATPGPLPRARQTPVSIEERVAALPGAARCARHLTGSAAWTARLPEAFPVYPRAATQVAAGTDTDGCALRGAGFVTPVPLEDVLAFYAALARQGGFAFKHLAGGGVHRLSGRKGAAAFALDLETRDDGLTRAYLTTSGV